MGTELDLVSDGSGLAVIGAPSAIEQFMLDFDLVKIPSRPLVQAFDGVRGAGGAGGLALQVGGQIAAESGRWL